MKATPHAQPKRHVALGPGWLFCQPVRQGYRRPAGIEWPWLFYGRRSASLFIFSGCPLDAFGNHVEVLGTLHRRVMMAQGGAKYTSGTVAIEPDHWFAAPLCSPHHRTRAQSSCRRASSTHRVSPCVVAHSAGISLVAGWSHHGLLHGDRFCALRDALSKRPAGGFHSFSPSLPRNGEVIGNASCSEIATAGLPAWCVLQSASTKGFVPSPLRGQNIVDPPHRRQSAPTLYAHCLLRGLPRSCDAKIVPLAGNAFTDAFTQDGPSGFS